MRTETIQIPRTLNQATRALGGLDRLLTARQWEKAAIVWAFTYEGSPGPQIARNPARSTIREFARQGIAGLRSSEQVSAYRNAWRRAIDEAEAPDVGPGDEVRLPDLEWKFPPDGSHEERYVNQRPERVARALDEGRIDPEELARHLSPRTADRVAGRIAADHPQVAARHGRKAIEDENRAAFARAQREMGVSDPMTSARRLLGGRRPYMEAGSHLHHIRVSIRNLGHLRDELEDDERREVLEDLEDDARYLAMVIDLYRSKANLDSELAAFLSNPEGEE